MANASPVLSLILGALLAGCADSPRDPPDSGPDDPVIRAALAEPLMIDPDLVSQNRGLALLAPPAPADGALPGFDLTPAAAARAAADVRRALGKHWLVNPPSAREPIVLPPGLTLADRTAALVPAACAGAVTDALAWSAELPAALPIYPRANLRDAAGADGAGCTVRAAQFVASADPAEVAAFYYTLGKAAGFDGAVHRTGDQLVLRAAAAGGSGGYLLVVRPWPGGAEAELIVRGL